LSGVHLSMIVLAGPWALIGVVPFQLLWARTPLVRRIVLDLAPDDQRATLLSWMSAATRLTQVAMMPAVSWLVNRGGAGAGFLFTAIVLVGVGLACVALCPASAPMAASENRGSHGA